MLMMRPFFFFPITLVAACIDMATDICSLYTNHFIFKYFKYVYVQG